MVLIYNSEINSVVGFLHPHIAIVTKDMKNTLYCDIECYCTTENEALFKEGTIICIKGVHGGMFRIKNPISTGKRLKARCYSLYEDAKNYAIQSLILDNEPISTALEKAKAACDSEPILNFFTDFPDDVTVTCTFTNTTLSAVLETLAELTGGFLKTEANTVNLLQSLGKTLIKELRYGSNIKSFKKIEDWSNVCTKIMPIGNEGIMLDEVYLESETQYERPYTKVVEFEQKLEADDSIPIGAALYNLALKTNLKTLATDYLEDHAEPEISYEVEAHIDFDVDVGDILPVIYPRLAVNKEVQVQELQWDGIAQKYKSVKFGKRLPTISGLYKDLTVRVSGDLSTEGIWHKLKLSNDFAAYDGKNTNYPEYKRIGNVVSVRGILTVNGNDIQTSKNYITMALGIPAECCPSKDVKALCQGTGANKWLCTITTDGKIQLSRYGTTEYESIVSGTWLPFNITYFT